VSTQTQTGKSAVEKMMSVYVKRLIMAGLGVGISAGLYLGSGAREPGWALETGQKVMELHREVLTLDSHVDIPDNFATPMVDAAHSPRQQVDLDKMDQGGLDAAFFIVYVGQGPRNDWGYDHARKAALNKFDAIHRMVAQYPDRIGLARTAAEVRRIAASGRKVALIGIENGFVIGRDLGFVQRYYDLGARYMTLTHNGHNDIGDSAQPAEKFGDAPEEYGGLSAFGRKVVEEMNRLGMLVDVSHVSKKTMLQATRHSRVPVIASHSGVRALVDHPRNMDDEQLLALKENGGVIQITAVDAFLKHRPQAYHQAVDRIRRELGFTEFLMERWAPQALYETYQRRLAQEVAPTWPPATVGDLVDHIDHVVKLIGIDHVGIASDFDGGGGIEGWRTAAETATVTAELVRRGYSAEDIAKIWGGNLLRVLKAAEDYAARIEQGQ